MELNEAKEIVGEARYVEARKTIVEAIEANENGTEVAEVEDKVEDKVEDEAADTVVDNTVETE